MMKYVSIARWRDLEDGHLYEPGENYPHDGRRVSSERVTALEFSQNRAGFALIKAVEEPKKKVVEETVETVEEAVEEPEKAVKKTPAKATAKKPVTRKKKAE